uniref:Cytosolic fatty-acid binding proteins domain-containing protein n=1 Tax=Leptocylindrus aporus TaxID=1398097 RepID=A0A7S0PHQ3_9STRA
MTIEPTSSGAEASAGAEPRTCLNGVWKLDKTRGEPSMRGYLEVMGVDGLAIEAHEKGERDVDTLHHILLTGDTYRVKKTSRVNNLQEEFALGKETLTTLADGNRQKKTLVESENNTTVRICTHMPTVNGAAEVTDVKTLVHEDNGRVCMHQELIIKNLNNGKTKVTRRWFTPSSLTPEISFQNQDAGVLSI